MPYSDPRGNNFRNDVSHGLVTPNYFNRDFSNRLLHILVVIGLLRVQTVDECTET